MSTALDARPVVRSRAGADGLAGTGVLVRSMLRRDRIRFPAWTLGLAVLMQYFTAAIGQLVQSEEDLQGLTGFTSSGVGALFGGVIGFDQLTIERFLVGQYGLYIILGASLMGLLTVVRHTRAEEQTGRAELVRANVVGRHAQLTAALVMTLLMSFTVTVLVALVMIGGGYGSGGAVLFGASIGAAGIVFGAVAAVTAQLSEYPRAAAGMAGGVLGIAFVLRGFGDMASSQGAGPAWLSWLSPIGWSQQTGPYTYDRWWPLGISVAAACVCAAVGYYLSTRRDVGAALIPPSPGSPTLAAWVTAPAGLALRLQRPGLIGWTVSVAVAGAAFGAFTKPIADGFADAPEELTKVLGGSGDLLRGYLGVMGSTAGFLVAVFAVLAVQALKSEETEGRAEPALACAISRTQWMTGWLAVTVAAVPVLLLAMGLGTGLGAGIGTGDASLIGSTVLGHVAHTPAVWTVLAVAALLYGITPRLTALVWVIVVYGYFAGMFGALLNLPDAMEWLSPFAHIGNHPADPINGAAVAILVAVAAVIAALGLRAFGRRDLALTT
ncbi:ABC transporter permease [Tsukamurella pulmonis]|uniref:ABC-2 type transport system permease protein n=1 Tax=Tsukamurella pulmonis TaxID=47312 RepID=A0A1H1HQW6_9ACTN|nr:ABC transporter permease [Tsukamurella pulmonis]KXO94464.1 ABC transporter permease [Tsukamurella pulmonis]SDR27777.1 ABC-2 type transport system permease protein [Tsukamurella pulmonis]SUP13579.1 ABC-2 family transporter protein [Tsukamurella pulmonis]